MGLLNPIIKKLIISQVFFLFAIITQGASASDIKHWIFFNAKGDGQSAEISRKALERRLLRGVGEVETDYDIYPDIRFIDDLESIGLTVHHVSRWLNAASVSGDSSMLHRANTFDFVKAIKPVSVFKQDRFENTYDSQQKSAEPALPPSELTDIDYGPSYTQLHLCQIDSLHRLGYSGNNILIGIMDTGFDTNHPVFQEITNSGRIIAVRDFINGDDYVGGDGIQQQHGTAVFSVLGGFRESSLIGAAFGADYILAKTEIVDDEITAEEDNWIVAAEWMEAEGADIFSSSLGYYDWYDTTDLDGNTTAITIAADAAASLGVIVVNAAGNERNSWWNAIIPPADGDSVVAVGGVRSDGSLWSGSSPGPTADGRIKPDVAAMASGVYAAIYSTNEYRTFGGTSMATPVVAGGLALVLEAHQGWNLDDIFNNLKMTASIADNPDNDFGWGIPDFFDMFAVDGFFVVSDTNPAINWGDTIDIYIALFDSRSSPGGNHDIHVSVGNNSTAELISNLEPAGLDTLRQKIYFPLPGTQIITIRDNISGQTYTLELYVYGSIDFTVAPNPALNSVVFLFDLIRTSNVDISIFNVAGDKIKTISIPENATYDGVNRKSWDGLNGSGNRIASGIYLAHLKTDFGSQIIKFAFIG